MPDAIRYILFGFIVLYVFRRLDQIAERLRVLCVILQSLDNKLNPEPPSLDDDEDEEEEP